MDVYRIGCEKVLDRGSWCARVVTMHERVLRELGVPRESRERFGWE